MMERILLILLAVGLAGSIGAFFLYVAILPVIGIAAVIVGMGAMFYLGFSAAQRAGTGEDVSEAREAKRSIRAARPLTDADARV